MWSSHTVGPMVLMWTINEVHPLEDYWDYENKLYKAI